MSRTITAMFDDRAHAEAAVRQLIQELHLDSTRVQMHAADATVETTQAATHDTGFWASLKDLFVPEEDRTTYVEGVRRGAVVVSAQLEDRMLDYAMDILEQHGAVDLDRREAEWRQQGWTGAQAGSAGSATTTASANAGQGIAAAGTTTATPTTTDRMTAHAGGEEVIPIAEERLRVGKRDVERGRVRVRSYVVETPVTEQVTLREEHVDVQRRTADRPVTNADVLFQERTIEATESAEEAVVAKEARITGEVVIRKDATERTETVQDTVRRTEVDVDNTAGAASHATETATLSGATTTNPPGTAGSRAADETHGTNVSGAHPEQADGTPGNPPGTMASRAVDKTLDTNISGANPGKR
jgi:uncharacterized protein (TIGR02271 family)